MKIKLINKEQFNDLENKFNTNKGLLLQNKGYEGIRKEDLSKEDLKALEEINDLLKVHIVGFSHFQNFRNSKKTGEIELRFQYNYNADNPNGGISFYGVGYITLKELLNGFED